MKTNFFFAFCTAIFIMLFFLPNTSSAQSGNRRSEAEWTVMFYMDGDNDLEADAIIDINELELLGSTDEVNFIVQLDRIKGYDSSNDNWTDTRRFRIIKDEDTKTISSPVIQNLGEANMGDPETLSDFINWTVSEYPAKHYMLVFWDHGGGWQKKRGSDTNTSLVKSVCWDDTDSDDYLEQQEMIAALDATGVHFDIIGFDACLMGMIENMYPLRDYADILVASEDIIYLPGWDIENAFYPLISNPAVSASEIAATIVDSYGKYFEDGQLGYTLSAIDLSEIQNVTDKVNQLSEALIEDNSSWEMLQSVRDNVLYLDEPEYIDLLNWAELLIEQSTNENFVKLADSLIKAINTAVLNNVSDRENAGGISIYYPNSIDDYIEAYQSEGYEFTSASKWDELLEAISDLENYDLTVTITNNEGDFPDNSTIRIYEYTSGTYKYYKTVSAEQEGIISAKLPEGEYKFYVIINETVYYRSETFTLSEDYEMRVQLEATARLNCTITDSDNNPVSGAYVIVYDSIGKAVTYGYSDTEGNIEFTLSQDNYYATVYIDDSEIIASDTIELTENCQLYIQIPEMYQLTFIVTDADETPIADAYVYFYSATDNDTYLSAGYTDSAGSITTELLSGEYYAIVYVDGIEMVTSDTVLLSEDKQVDIRLPVTYKLSYSFSDADEEPVLYAVIAVYDANGSNSYFTYGYTDIEGYVEFNLQAGDYYIKASVNGVEIYEGSTIKLTEDLHIDIQDSNPTAIEQLYPDNQELYLYPNPTSGILYFSQSVNSAEVYELTGKLVAGFDEITNEVNLQNIENGMYIIKAFSKKIKINSVIILKK